MDARLRRMETTLAALQESMHALDARLARLEQQVSAAAVSEPSSAGTTWPVDDIPLQSPSRQLVAQVIVRTGAALLALAGAYFLRALTESGTLAPSAGVAAGLAYAVVWFGLADRLRATPIAAAFHASVACAIAFPLTWEATTKFALLDGGSSALVLSVVTTIALAVAAHRHLRAVAWIATFASIAFALAFVVVTNRVVPYATAVIVLGVLTLWLGYVRDWHFLRWPVAFVADVLVAGAAFRIVSGNVQESAALVAAVALLLPAAYLLNIIVRTVVRGRDVIPFEVVQSIAALGVGLGCVLTVARHAAYGIGIVGWGTLALGAACYAVAFLFIRQHHQSQSNLHFYSSIGLLLVVASGALLAHDPTNPYAILAVGTAIVSARSPSLLVTRHAVAYTGAAAIASGLLMAATFRLIGPTAHWPPLTASMILAVLSAGIGVVVTGRAVHTRAARGARFAILLPFVWGASGFLIDFAAHAVASGPTGLDPGIVATIRTVVIAAVAVAASAVARAEALREVGWLVYPLLVGGGVKLIADDIPHSRPATLFIALAVFGAALIVAPRVVPRSEQTRPTGLPLP